MVDPESHPRRYIGTSGASTADPHARRIEGTAWRRNGAKVSFVVKVPSKSKRARFMRKRIGKRAILTHVAPGRI